MSTFGAVISTVHRPSGASPSVTPSTLNDACGLIHRNCVTVPSIRTTVDVSKAAVEWWAKTCGMHAAAAAAHPMLQAASFPIVFIVAYRRWSRLEAGLAGLRAREIVVQVRQAFHFADIRVVDAQPVLLAAPLADPAVRIRHDVLDLHDARIVEQPDTLLDLEILGDRDAGIDVVVVGLDVLRVDDQRIPLPMPDRFAVVRIDDRVRVGVLAAVEE